MSDEDSSPVELIVRSSLVDEESKRERREEVRFCSWFMSLVIDSEGKESN